MKIENELEQYILKRYKSIMQFSKEVGLPYTTVKGMFARGIWGASVQSVNKICNLLNIEVNELMQGKIVESGKSLKLNSHEQKLIIAYRQQPSMQEAVDRLLGIEVETIPSLTAARSSNNHEPIQIENVPDLSKFEPDDADL